MDYPTARAQYPQDRVMEVYSSVKGIIRHVRVMTAGADKLNPHLPCKRTCLDRDSTKVALVKFSQSTLSLKGSNLIHPLMMIFNLPDSGGFPAAPSIKLASAGVL